MPDHTHTPDCIPIVLPTVYDGRPMTRTTPEALAELRRLLNAGTPVPWAQGDPAFGVRNAQCVVSISERAMGRDVMGPTLRPALFDVELIVAAVTALPALLDAAAERDALAAKVERVRELHEAGRWYSDHCDDPECDREHVELEVGNLYHADVYDLVCETCSGGDLSETDDPAPWPCPTIRALDPESEVHP